MSEKINSIVNCPDTDIFPDKMVFKTYPCLYYEWLKWIHDNCCSGGITPQPGGTTTKSYHISFMNVLNNTLPTTLDTSTVKYGVINDSVSEYHVIAFKDNNISTVHYTKDDIFYVDTLLYYQNGNYSYFEPPNMEIRQVDPDTLDETILLDISRSNGSIITPATNCYTLYAINYAYDGVLPPNPNETSYILIKENNIYNLYRMRSDGTTTPVDLTTNDLLFTNDNSIHKTSNSLPYTPDLIKSVFKVNASKGSIIDLTTIEKADLKTIQYDNSMQISAKISTTDNNRLTVDTNGLFVGDPIPTKEDTKLSITFPKYYYGENVTVTVILTTKDTNLPIAGRTVRLNGETLPNTDVNGKTTKTYSNVISNRDLTASFSGDDKYNSSTATTSLQYWLHTEILAPPVVIENLNMLSLPLTQINNHQVISISFDNYSTIGPFNQTELQIVDLLSDNYITLQFSCIERGKLDLTVDEVVNGNHILTVLCELGVWQDVPAATLYTWSNTVLGITFNNNLCYLTPSNYTAALNGNFYYNPSSVVQLPIQLNEIKGSNKYGMSAQKLLITDNKTVKGYYTTDSNGSVVYVLTNVTSDHTINIKYTPDNNYPNDDPAETTTSITLHDSTLIDTHFVNSDVTYPANSSVKMEVIVIDSNDAVPTQGKVQITENGVTNEYPVGNIEYTPNTTSTHNIVLNYIDNGSPLKYNNCSKTITVNIQTQKITPVITATSTCLISGTSLTTIQASLKLADGTCLPNRWLIANNDKVNTSAPQDDDCSVLVALACAPVAVGDTIDVIYDPDSQPVHPEDKDLYNKVTKTITVVACNTPTDIQSNTFEISKTTSSDDFDIDSETFDVVKTEGSGKLTSTKFEVS